MNRIVAFLFIMLSFLITPMTFASAEEVRNRCIALFLDQCMSKCATADGVDCSDNCQQNAENQCREAGE